METETACPGRGGAREEMLGPGGGPRLQLGAEGAQRTTPDGDGDEVVRLSAEVAAASSRLLPPLCLSLLGF